MIPGDQKTIDKLKALAARNIANGDWGDEVNAPGIPGSPDVPVSSDKLASVTEILAKSKGQKLPKRKK